MTSGPPHDLSGTEQTDDADGHSDTEEDDHTGDRSDSGGINRRTVLRSATASGIIGIAGCSDSSDSPDDGSGGDETEIPALDTDEGDLEPGENTEFGDGLSIATHPFALAESIHVRVRWLDPDQAIDPATLPDRDLSPSTVLELTIPDLDDPWVELPTDTGIFLGVPVPDELDPTQTEALLYDDGFFADDTDTDAWARESIFYDPADEIFILDLEAIGSRASPTAVTFVEDDRFEPTIEEGFFAQITEEEFPRLADEWTRDEWIWDEPENAGDSESIESLSNTNNWGFEIEWKADASEDQGLMDDVEEALEKAFPVYISLPHGPWPKLRTTARSKIWGVNTVTFKYYITDEDANDGCKGNRTGFYSRNSKRARTCVDINTVETTTAHELFHAFQYGFGTLRFSRDLYMHEAFARLMEDVDDLLGISEKENLPPIDARINYPGEEYEDPPYRAYRREYFAWDLFHRNNLDVDHVGDLYRRGLEHEDMEEFIDLDVMSIDSFAEAHWEWAKNAAFEGNLDPDGSYQSCAPTSDAVHGDIEIIDIDDTASLVAVGDTHELQEVSIGGVEANAAALYELNLPVMDGEEYSLEFSFDGPTPNNVMLYPGGDECTPTGSDWEVKAYHGGTDETLALTVRDPSNPVAYLLVQGPFDETTLVVHGPQTVLDVELSHPVSPAEVDYGTDQFVWIVASVGDPGGEMEDVAVEFALDGTPIESASTIWDSVDELPADEQLIEFEFPATELCAAGDPDDTPHELSIELTAIDSDGDHVATDRTVVEFEPEYPDVLFGYTMEYDSEWSATVPPVYNPTVDSPPRLIATTETTQGMQLDGWARRCEVGGIDDGDTDESDGIQWWDAELEEEGAGDDALLSDNEILQLQTPDAFRDADGEPKNRLFRMAHDTLPGQKYVLVESCEPYCFELEQIEIDPVYLNPVLACQDGALNPDCSVQTIGELEMDLEERIEQDLFDGQSPETGFPLEEIDHWRSQTDLDTDLKELATAISEASVDHPELSEAEFLPFVFAVNQIHRDWQSTVSDEAAEAGLHGVETVAQGLELFGAPDHGGWNAWRFIGHAIDADNPGTVYRQVDLQPVVEAGILGIGAALTATDTGGDDRLNNVQMGAAYGFLTGVVAEATRIEPRSR